MASSVLPNDDNLTFESNKINGPPNKSHRVGHQYSSSTTLIGDGSRSLFPKRQISLKLLSPNSKHLKKNHFKHDRSTTAFDDIATPKTRGIKLLKKTSSQYNNKEFQKRLSIPSFHVADQILMDILTEQNQPNNNGMNLNMIREDETHEDDEDISILDFLDEEENDYSDTDIDSLMTLDAFPDLPDFGLNNNNNDNNDNNDDNDNNDNNEDEEDEDSRNLTVVTASQEEYTPITVTYDESFDDEEESFEDNVGDTPYIDIGDTPYADEEDFEDDDECLTPRTYNRLFNTFHHMDEKKDEDADIETKKELAINITKPRSFSVKDLAINIAPKRSFSKPLGMKINIAPFKSEGANKSDDEQLDFVALYEEEEEERMKERRIERGFSHLQRAASLKVIEDKDNITTLLRKSASYSAVESMTIINAERERTTNREHLNGNSLKPVLAQKRMSSAESAIAVAKELLETEVLYQNHLKNLQYILLNPIISTYFGNDCISSIFYKLLCDIISVSKSFTMRLAIYVKALQIPQLANWIYFSCKRFGVYAHYAKMYDIFLDRLTLCKNIDDNIEFWIRRQEKCYKTELKNQKLHSLLMMPVQRLPRYILLLEELIKYTQRIELEEYTNDAGTILFLELAKSEIQTVSQRVNEMVRQRENRSNLKELINRFCGANKAQLLRSNRVLVYEGFLFKVRKYKIKYYFHLFSDILTYSNINNNGLFNIHRIIYLQKVAIIDLPNVDDSIKQKKKRQQKQKKKKKSDKYKNKIWYRFLLKSQEKSFELLTENEQEKQNWLLLIKAAISRLTSTNVNNEKGKTPVTPLGDGEYPDLDDIDFNNMKSPISRRKTVADEDCYAPYWVPDDASNKCMLCETEFTILCRRHHCRRCGTLVCKQCSKTKKLLMNIDKHKAVRICDGCVMELEADLNKLTPYASHASSPNQQMQIEINTMRLSEFFPDTNIQNTKEDEISKQILKYTRQYKHKLRVLLEHFCRPIMDVVENNKIIIDFITTKKFYNQSNIKINEVKKEDQKQKKPKQSKIIREKKNKKKELRKKKRKQTLDKNRRNTFSVTDTKAAAILNNLYKLKCGHKTLIALCTIVEQIYDIICLLHSELKLIIFKKHVNYEDDMILDYFELNNCHLNDADNARIGRLFMLYTDLFNIHIDYASRFPECYHIIIGNVDKTENHLIDFIKDVKLSLVSLNKDFILQDLLQQPLDFTRKIYQFLMKINLKIDSSMVNSSDLDLCIRTLKQLLLDLDKEKSESQDRIKLYKLQSSFDFSVDFRERGRTLIISDFITKITARHSHNYYFHLFSNILCYSAKKLGNSKFVFKNSVYLRDIIIVADGMLFQQDKKTKTIKKKNKKHNLKTITIKYSSDIAPFHDKSDSNMDNMQVITEEDEEKGKEREKEKVKNIKTFSLVFNNKDTKQCWFELLNNLVNEERGKYANKIKVSKVKKNPFDEYRNKRNNNRHLRSRSLNAVKKSKKQKNKDLDDDKEQFCGICHSSFNRLYNESFKCIGCKLAVCDACCMDKFYVSKKFIAPKYLKLCMRCNYYNHNERSCNIQCI